MTGARARQNDPDEIRVERVIGPREFRVLHSANVLFATLLRERDHNR